MAINLKTAASLIMAPPALLTARAADMIEQRGQLQELAASDLA